MGNKVRQYKSWRDKLENPPEGLPKVVSGPPSWEKTFGGRRVLVPTPLLVDDLICKVAKGKLVTVTQIRERLAQDFKADSTCPLTTGIHIRIAAEVAEEGLRMGKKEITPYWRVLKAGGSLNPKFPGGVEVQAVCLKEEGHSILPSKGKRPPKVKNFEKCLQKL